ncbi:hypothetical protein LCGC14_0276700 [marine sediment metagenome]|uniref:Uncharacterized protein n=1 Tax=marine sediment metagenome TaxID=412755 RepID=A0A0F9WIA8_9ZZZZ
MAIAVAAFARPPAELPPPRSPTTRPAAQQPRGLDRKVDVFFVSGTLEEALAEVQRLSGLSVRVDWRGLEDIGLTSRYRVVLRADHVTLEQALDLILSQVAPPGVPLGHVARASTVYVTTRATMGRLSAAKPLPTGRSPASTRTPSARTARPASPARRTVSATTPTELQFDETALEDIINSLRRRGLDIDVNWPGLQVVGIDRDTPLSFNLRRATFARALDRITGHLNGDKDKLSKVYWLVADGAVQLTTGHALNSDLKTVMFDVGDLLMTAPNFAGPRLDVAALISEPQGESSGNIFLDDEQEEEESPAARRKATRDSLIHLIKSQIGEDMWDDAGGKGSIKIMGGRLIISQTKLGFLLLARSSR